ncbi:MAG TPA: DUF2062 domain-containing protein [Desulfobulbus sp.]|nr:DUF2062 domain-containing protein [Desulfobulbus sp.]
MLSFSRTIRYYFLRFARLRGDPHSLAVGTGFGVFIGIVPLMPVQTIILVPLTILLRINTLAALIAATAVSNPLTFIPQYYLTWKVGDMLLPGRISWEQLQEVLHLIRHESLWHGIQTFLHLGFNTIAVLLCGGVLIGLPVGLLAYYASLLFFIKVRRKRMAKHKLD